MPDNFPLTPGSGRNAATDQVTYSGDTADVQLVRVVTTTGSEGSKTVVDLPGDATNGLDVDVTRVQGSVTVANGGTFVTQTDGAALTALQLLDDSIIADDAAFTVGTTKVNVAGALAVSHGSTPDVADSLDAVAPLANRHRIPFTLGGHPNIVTVKHTTITTAVTNAAIISVSAGTRIVVTAITAVLDNASTVFPTLLVGFHTTTTPTTTGVILCHGGVPAGGGVNRGDGSGIIGIGASDEDLLVTTTGNATGNGLQIIVTYFTIADA